jgi:ribosomal protein S18 acetylase RimI-like enzyme
MVSRGRAGRAQESSEFDSRAWLIRRAGHAELDRVLSLWQVAGITAGVSDSVEGLSLLLAADPEALLVAERDGHIVGSLIAAWDGWRGSFYRLAVHPARRREGLATALLREGERQLQRRGAARLTAIVAEDEPLAVDFWRAVGYRRQPGRGRYLRHLGS